MNQREPKPVTIEDLLKLKRMERPSGDFWAQFERELRAKQLAAIVERRPWWHRLSRGAVFVSRQHIPIGAVAVLALTWVSVRQFDADPIRSRAVAPMGRGFEAVSGAAPASGSMSASRSDAGSVATPSLMGAQASEMQPLSLPREEAEGDASAEDAAEAPVVQSLVPVAASHLTPAPVAAVAAIASEPARPATSSIGSAGSASDELFSPSARLIASNLSAVREADPDSSHRFLVSGQDFAASASPATVATARRMVDPMTRVNPSSEERRSRLLSASLPAAGGAEVISTAMSDRAESRLSSDRLYDSISRYGVDGHSFSIKF
jgi:hypothetical protein